MRALRAMLAVALALLVLAAPTAHAAGKAKPPPKVDAARDRTMKGYALYQAGKYLEAATEFEVAYGIKPDPGLLYNAAQSARLGGDLRRAQTLYSSYISFHPDGANLADAKGHLEKLDAALKAEEEARRAAAASVTSRPTTAAGLAPESTPPREEPTPEPAPRADKKPVHKRWYFWVGLVGGAALVATGVTLGIVLTRPVPPWSNAPDFGPGAPAAAGATIRF